jgi:hypothetical protein
VQLRADKGQQFLQAYPLQGAGGGGEVFLRYAVSQVLHDGRALGDHLAIVELQRGHIALRVDGEVVVAAGSFLAGEVDAHEVEVQAGFAQDDVGGQRAGAGGVIELHGFSCCG